VAGGLWLERELSALLVGDHRLVACAHAAREIRWRRPGSLRDPAGGWLGRQRVVVRAAPAMESAKA
jgi:hypothetical protein